MPTCTPQNHQLGHGVYHGTAPIFMTTPHDALAGLSATSAEQPRGHAGMLPRRLKVCVYTVPVPKPRAPRASPCPLLFSPPRAHGAQRAVGPAAAGHRLRATQQPSPLPHTKQQAVADARASNAQRARSAAQGATGSTRAATTGHAANHGPPAGKTTSAAGFATQARWTPTETHRTRVAQSQQPRSKRAARRHKQAAPHQPSPELTSHFSCGMRAAPLLNIAGASQRPSRPPSVRAFVPRLGTWQYYTWGTGAASVGTASPGPQRRPVQS